MSDQSQNFVTKYVNIINTKVEIDLITSLFHLKIFCSRNKYYFRLSNYSHPNSYTNEDEYNLDDKYVGNVNLWLSILDSLKRQFNLLFRKHVLLKKYYFLTYNYKYV